MEKSLFESKATAVTQQSTYTIQPLKLMYSTTEFIELIRLSAQEHYAPKHTFLTDYLLNLITLENKDLIRLTSIFKKHLNQREYKDAQIFAFGMEMIKHSNSPLWTLIKIWKSYLEYEIKRIQVQIQEFLKEQIHLFTEMVFYVLKSVEQNFKKKQNEIKIKLHLLDYLSRCELFSSVMETFFLKFSVQRGSKGQSTDSQIFQTKEQFEKLFNFHNIDDPFPNTLVKIEQFHSEHCLIPKILKLIDMVAEVRKQIGAYRQKFSMKPIALGGQDMLPVLNYICEKTNLNIIGSIAYINAFVGHEEKMQEVMLRQVSEEAEYTISVVEIAASFYCHASQIV